MQLTFTIDFYFWFKAVCLLLSNVLIAYLMYQLGYERSSKLMEELLEAIIRNPGEIKIENNNYPDEEALSYIEYLESKLVEQEEDIMFLTEENNKLKDHIGLDDEE